MVATADRSSTSATWPTRRVCGYSNGGNVEASNRVTMRGVGGLPAVIVARRGSTNYSISGVTVDGTGAPLGGMAVYLFRAGSMELVAQGESDGSGNYTLISPTNAGSFVVASFHLDGSLAGITRPVLEAI